MGSSMKDRWRQQHKLQAFALASDAEDELRENEAPPLREVDEKFSEPHSTDVATKSRKDVAETARVPIPTTARRVTYPHDNPITKPPQHHEAAFSSQSRSNEPTNRLTTDAEDHQLSIFAGSELGEHFMNSGRTTPVRDEVDEAGHFGRPDKPKVEQPNRLPSRRSRAFVVEEGGFMSVVSPRQPVSQMNDGFYAGPNRQTRIETQYGQSSPHKRKSDLPLRGLRVKRSNGERPAVGDIKETFRSGSPVPQNRARQYDNDKRWPMYEFSEDGSTDNDQNTLEVTPKARRPKVPSSSASERLPPTAPSIMQTMRDKKRRHESLDYDDQALSFKTFSDLQGEPFDYDPGKAAVTNGLGVGEGDTSFKLEQFRLREDAERRHAFATMPLDEWETAGDWFVDQFSDIMQRLRDVRRNKRRMVQEFELEAADREEAVRLRLEAIDRKLSKMRQDGQRVVNEQGGR